MHSVVSDEFGRLFSLRVTNQNTMLVNLPASLLAGHRADADGRLQRPARAAAARPGERSRSAAATGPQRSPPGDAIVSARRAELSVQQPELLVSAGADHRLRDGDASGSPCRPRFSCVATGELASGSPTLVAGQRCPASAQKVYPFTAARPVRYLAFLVSRFCRAAQMDRRLQRRADRRRPAGGPAVPRRTGRLSTSSISSVEANPRQTDRGRERRRSARRTSCSSTSRSSAIRRIRASRWRSSRATLPGGHSPGYFAVLNQPLPDTPLRWRNDPAAFDGYPEFFLAHELAHQWWGQAVGWRNYHEQWLSEGFAQYFAALYAQQLRGDDDRSPTSCGRCGDGRSTQSDQGPVYLGLPPRAHPQRRAGVFRALVYNKGAPSCTCCGGSSATRRSFAASAGSTPTSRFQKAGTEDFREAMEAEAGRSLERFFERWIYGSTLPRVTFSYRVESAAGGQEVVLRFEQTGEIFDLPVTVTLQYADRRSVDVVVPVTDASVDMRVAARRHAAIASTSAGTTCARWPKIVDGTDAAGPRPDHRDRSALAARAMPPHLLDMIDLLWKPSR